MKKRAKIETSEHDIKTPRQLRKHRALNDNELLFLELIVLCHRSANEAYRIAFRSSNANLSSAASLASRLLREDRVKDYYGLLTRYYANNHLPPCEKYSL